MNLKRVNAIAKKEFIQIIRDYRSLALAIFIPVLLLMIFGFALSLDVDNIPMVIWNQDKSQVSRNFILSFKNSSYFHIVGYADNYQKLQRDIDSRVAMMALVIPTDFAKQLEAGQTASLQLLVDGSDSNTATIAMGYVNTIVSQYNVNLIMNMLSATSARNKSLIDMRPRVWFNENLKSRNYIIPGLIAVIMMIIAALLTSITVAKEWENGTMEQLISTPVRREELILGKLIPYFVIGFIDLIIAVAVGQFVFGVPLRGSVFLLFVLSSVFLVGALAQGLYFSIVSKNQRLATQLAIITTFLPTFLLSGFIYPIYNMPKVIQVITYALPARYFITILKGIYLKGEGFSFLWKQTLFLLVFAAITLIAAYRKFEKKVI